MANKIYTERCGDQIKAEKTTQNKKNNLIEKLQSNLEKDILRLFQSSLYCDIKLTVNASYISTHSCILKTRACKFYKFLYAEFEVLTQNGISVFNFYNASFAYLQAFIQNVYTNFHSSKEEDSIIKHLQESKTHSVEKSATDSFYLLPAGTNPVSPESDLFFTPKCSPSELQKSFAPELKSKENVVSYYKIVSVDDIPIDDKSERSKTDENAGKREVKLLEQELAEQDELLLSFKTIFVKKNKNRESQFLNHSNSSQFTKKTIPKADKKKSESSTNVNETRDEFRKKLHLWKANNISGESGFPGSGTSSLKSTKINRIRQICQKGIAGKESAEDSENFLCNSDMDASGTGCDSGLDASSVCQPEASPRENTFSETSGVDLTESITTDDIPNDETVSANRPGTNESSPSSEAGTWDARCDSKRNGKVSADFVCSTVESSGTEENRNCDSTDPDSDDKNNLNEEELIRLDEMERTMRECEMFLSVERNQSDPTFGFFPGENVEGQNSVKRRRDCGDGEMKVFADDGNEEMGNADSNGFETPTENVFHSGGSVWQQVESDESNSRNPEMQVFTVRSDSDSDVKLRVCEIGEETKTPPCTPEKSKAEDGFEIDRNREGIKYPETKPDNKWENNNNNNNYSSGNYFIDASSLLDEDEIVSPPISLINYRSIRSEDEPETRKKVITNFYDDANGEPEKESESFRLRENERRKGDVIFGNSVRYFPRREMAGNDVSMDEKPKKVGADECEDCEDGLADDGEQVVPTADAPMNSFQQEEFSNSRQVSPGEGGGNSSELQETKNSPSGIVVPEENTEGVGSNNSFEGISRMESSEMDFSDGKKEPSRNHGEAWVVTFGDGDKCKNKMSGSVTKIGDSDDTEIEEERKKFVSNRNSSRVQSFDRKREENDSSEEMGFAVEKSSSLGYFLDFGKRNDREEPVNAKSEKPPGNRTEKKNIFSMFIGMDDVSVDKKSNSVAEMDGRGETSKENVADVSADGLGAESREETKKSFYMFIESDSPGAKRKQISKKTAKSYVESRPGQENAGKNKSPISVRRSEPETENDSERPSFNNFREPEMTDRDERCKLMAWAETKSSAKRGTNLSAESWLKTDDIRVNYTGKNKRDFPSGESKEKIESKEVFTDFETREKSPKKKSAGGGGGGGFLKLSDMDDVISGEERNTIGGERMSRSVSETVSGKRFPVGGGTSTLSKSTGSERENGERTENGVDRSLSRIFPNVSSSHLARVRKMDDGKGERERSEIQGSEHSEFSNSMHSSMEPSTAEISTSETDVSAHGGATSRLGQDLLKMFLEEIGPDVTLEVSGRRIKAHKCILSSRCQYFAAMLSGGWVESAGNVISLQGFSYNAVHFALRYIYSGESRIPESLNVVELATLADMLCLDGLQEIISYDLKVKYCHSFHAPCSICSVGVIDCLPIAAAYGLDDLYRKCLRWITKYFVKLWPTKSFGSLPKELLEKCYQHHVVHMTVDNVLDTMVNIDKVRGSLTNVRWAESVSRLVKKLHGAAVRYIAEHFSSILTSDGFLALGKDDGWNVSRLEDSLIETINYLPPEQACWSHARLHRILSVANGHDPPAEMDWNENFVKLLHLIGELVENSLIKQAPRAAKSKAWRQLEPELRSRIQEAACLVLPDEEPIYRKPQYIKKNSSQLTKMAEPAAASRRSLEIRQIKLAMSQQANRNPSRPLSLQSDQKAKKESRFVPLRPSASTSSVRKSVPQVETIRKSQSKSQILGSAISEPKKTINPRYSEVKSRYLEPKSPQKSGVEKHGSGSGQRRNSNVSCCSRSSSALRSYDSRNSIPTSRKLVGSNRQSSRNSAANGLPNDGGYREKSFASTRSETPSNAKTTAEETMSTDSLCTDSLKSEKEATVSGRKTVETVSNGGKVNGRENRFGTRSSSVAPAAKSHGSVSETTRKLMSPTAKRTNPTRIPNSVRANAVSSPRSTTRTPRNPNASNKIDTKFANGNCFGRGKSRRDSAMKEIQTPRAPSRSGTFLKEEPTILKKPETETEPGRY